MIERAELQDAASKAFPADGLIPPREASWNLAADMATDILLFTSGLAAPAPHSATDSLGGADAVFVATIDCLRTRCQFDRPLAISHGAQASLPGSQGPDADRRGADLGAGC